MAHLGRRIIAYAEKTTKSKRKNAQEQEHESETSVASGNNRQSKRRRLEDSTEEGGPKTKAYEALLSGAADEILAVLKNDTLKNSDKKKDIAKLLKTPLPHKVFDLLVSIGRLITDIQEEDTLNDDDDDVEFEEDDEESNVNFVPADDDELDIYASIGEDENDGGVNGPRDVENGRQLLDLKSIAFKEGGHLTSNSMCTLPLGSYTNETEAYEEVHIPALKPKPIAPDEKLVKISDMPSWAQPAFEGMMMTHLNRVQSKVYETALFKADNLLVCAPTGAGKTNVALLTILERIHLHMNEDGTFNHSDYKIVYVAPTKVLVAEVVRYLCNRLKNYGVTVSGDESLFEESQIIVTTPEKWDSITRESGIHTYTQRVKLLIIDEIHLLHDNRGPVLASILARTVRQIETTKERIRLVGLLASLPNFFDVAALLQVELKKGLFHFDNSYRACPLAQQHIGISVKDPQLHSQLMDDICYEKVKSAVAGKHQVIIFVRSRKETTKTARAIRDTSLANGIVLKEDSCDILRKHIEFVKSNELKDLLPYGLAIYNAGMCRDDCELVEKLFTDGHIQVLVSTSGNQVNLPRAHTVIIKGTYRKKGELGPVDVMQMLGHAGRPQIDAHGEGIIITRHRQLLYYLSLMDHMLPIESQFVSKMADHLNAEIVLGTVRNLIEAADWLSYTYLFLRMVRRRTLYGLPDDALKRDYMLADRRADLVHSAAIVLDNNNLVKYDRKNGSFQVTDLGRIASYYNIPHETIAATYKD